MALVALPGFDATPFTTSYGGRLSFGNVSTSTLRHAGRPELVAGAGRDPSADSRVKTFWYDQSSSILNQLPTEFVPFGSATYGVSVGTGGLGY